MAVSCVGEIGVNMAVICFVAIQEAETIYCEKMRLIYASELNVFEQIESNCFFFFCCKNLGVI
jgi:hypothetical protein